MLRKQRLPCYAGKFLGGKKVSLLTALFWLQTPLSNVNLGNWGGSEELFPESAGFWLPLVPNNSHAKETYLGVAISALWWVKEKKFPFTSPQRAPYAERNLDTEAARLHHWLYDLGSLTSTSPSFPVGDANDHNSHLTRSCGDQMR